MLFFASCSSNYLIGKWSFSKNHEILGGIVKSTWSFDANGDFERKTEHCFKDNKIVVIAEEFGKWSLNDSWLEVELTRNRVLNDKKDNPMNSKKTYTLKKISNNCIELLDTEGEITQLTKED